MLDTIEKAAAVTQPAKAKRWKNAALCKDSSIRYGKRTFRSRTAAKEHADACEMWVTLAPPCAMKVIGGEIFGRDVISIAQVTWPRD